jgi:2-polyprenyl-6-methoxyphenol hydroxylase-like FAD-dependent oxidoreductase
VRAVRTVAGVTAIRHGRDTSAIDAMPEREFVDVAIIGFGPVGQGLALMLGRRGYRVHAFERQPLPYPLPRAVCIDHEIRRVLGSVGMEDDIVAITHPSPRYKWYNANWELLLDIDWTRESISGGPDVNFVHQPTLEERLSAAACREASVTLDMGYDVTSLDERGDRVAIRAMSRESDAERHIEARYVVGADGANSFVRRVAGIDSHDRGFEADWLVIDIAIRFGRRRSFRRGNVTDACTGVGNSCDCPARAKNRSKRSATFGNCSSPG